MASPESHFGGRRAEVEGGEAGETQYLASQFAFSPVEFRKQLRGLF